MTEMADNVVAGGLQVAVDGFSNRNRGQSAFEPTWRTFGAFKPAVGSGEMRFDVHFPYYFTGRPLFTYGFELDENQGLVAGSFPLHSATVAPFAVSTRESDWAAGVFVGATVATVLDGPALVSGVFHLVFQGMAMAAPVGGIDGMTTADSV